MAATAKARPGSAPIGVLSAEIESLYLAKKADGETIPSTLSNVRRVLRLLPELGIETTADIGDDTYSRLDGHIKATLPHLGTRSRLNLLRTFKAVCGHAVELRLMGRMPDWPTPTDPRKLPAPDRLSLPTVVVMRLRDHLAKGLDSFKGHRLYALFMVVFHAGLRLGEALALEVLDIDLAGRTIRVRGREGKNRTRYPSPVPIDDDLMPVLERWLAVTGPRYVFRGIHKDKPWRNTGLAGYDPLSQLKAEARAAGIEQDVTFEALYWHFVAHARTGLGTVGITRPKSTTSPATASHTIRLGPPGQPTYIDDVAVKPLTLSQYTLVKALLEAGPDGMRTMQLSALKLGGWRESLSKLRGSNLLWAEIIVFPGRTHGRYRIAATMA